MKLMHADRCAWRGTYLYTDRGTQVARIVLDPVRETGPDLSIAFPVGWYRRGCDGRRFPRLVQLRFPMPTLRWKYPAGRLRMAAYQWINAFWHSLDGRYSRG